MSRENIGPLLNKAGKLVTNKADKAEIPNNFFASGFVDLAGPQITGTSSYNKTSPIKEERQICGLLQELKPHQSMSLDRIHPMVLREVSDIVAKSLFGKL